MEECVAQKRASKRADGGFERDVILAQTDEGRLI
jgi:hypothetical protein